MQMDKGMNAALQQRKDNVRMFHVKPEMTWFHVKHSRMISV